MNSDSINVLLSAAFCIILIVGVLIFLGIYIFKKFIESDSKLELQIEDTFSYLIEDNSEFIIAKCKLVNTGRDKIKFISTTAFLDNLQSETKDYNPYIYSITSEDGSQSIHELEPNQTTFAILKFKIDNKNIPRIINEFKYDVFLQTFHYENSILKGQPVQDTIVFTELNNLKNKYMYKFFQNISVSKGDYIFSLKINYQSDTQKESNLDKLSFAFNSNNMFELLLDRFLRKSILEIINYPLNVDTKVAPISPDSIEKL